MLASTVTSDAVACGSTPWNPPNPNPSTLNPKACLRLAVVGPRGPFGRIVCQPQGAGCVQQGHQDVPQPGMRGPSQLIRRLRRRQGSSTSDRQ